MRTFYAKSSIRREKAGKGPLILVLSALVLPILLGGLAWIKPASANQRPTLISQETTQKKLSPHRAPGTSFTKYIRDARQAVIQRNQLRNFNPTAMDLAQSLSDFDFSNVPAWASNDLVNSSFRYIRDVQFLSDENHGGLLRRSTWLFPDDGCYARAELAKQNIYSHSRRTVAKIFIFGDLNVETENSPENVVTWWYHVAPAVRTDTGVWVLDPAFDPAGPMPVKTWIAKQTTSIDSITISACDADTYDPGTNCESAESVGDRAVRDQVDFLESEWQRQIELNRNPEQVLGESPPWKK